MVKRDVSMLFLTATLPTTRRQRFRVEMFKTLLLEDKDFESKCLKPYTKLGFRVRPLT